MPDKKHIITIRTILSKRGVDEGTKEGLVRSATDGRTSSIREMTNVEAIGLIKALNGQKDNYKENADQKLKLKRKILAYCHEMGWEKADGKVDMKRVGAYCESRGYLKNRSTHIP